MTSQRAWPGKTNPIARINFALMTAFDAEGQPIYARGAVESIEEREMVQSILERLQPVPHTVASVAMGEVTIELEDHNRILLRPVFHPSLNTYGDLFFVDERQYPMPAKLAELLEKWRKQTPG